VLLDNKGEVATNMGLFSLPVTLLFDANEELVHSHVREISTTTLQQRIEQYFS